MPSISKAKKILFTIFLAFLLILTKVWNLTFIQRGKKVLEAEAPKRRVLIENASRGEIVDRFDIPLASNKISYNASIYYHQFHQVPSLVWTEENGLKKKTFPRKTYIRDLSLKLSTILKIDADRIEDLIHSKASLFPQAPFILKSGLTEEEHYKIASLEKSWIGIHAAIGAERTYPFQKVGSSILGTLGSISPQEYLSIAHEIKELTKQVEDIQTVSMNSVTKLSELKEKSYKLQDLVGKTGVEAFFEKDLRGFYGKKFFEIDPNGKKIRELVGKRNPIPGKKVALTISHELQKYAEEVLTEMESIRDGRSLGIDFESKTRKVLKQPWIKGGSIIVMDPNNGDILALASYPRFDPNDFIPSSSLKDSKEKSKNIHKWLEDERYIAAIWDGKIPLTRERFSSKNGFFEEELPLSLDKFLEFTLSIDSPIKNWLLEADVKTTIQVQEDFESVLYFSKLNPKQLIEKWKNVSLPSESLAAYRRLDHIFSNFPAEDCLFFIDLCRLFVDATLFTDDSILVLGSLKLAKYRSLNQLFCVFESKIKKQIKNEFKQNHFYQWKEQNQAEFLANKRKEEKLKKLTPKPYIDYLDQKENELFNDLWNEERLNYLVQMLKNEPSLEFLLKSPSSTKACLHTFRYFSDLEKPLLSSISSIRKDRSNQQLLKHLASAFYPKGGFGYTTSSAYQLTCPQGSIFKLVTSYAALLQTKGENPLVSIDEHRKDLKALPSKQQIVALSKDGVPYPRIYKGGRLPKTTNPKLGKIDLVGAIQGSSNPYFALLASEVLKDPEDLNNAAKNMGFGSRTGLELPGEARGYLPEDLKTNITGLYSTAIGQHKLLVTPIQTATMLSSIANGGTVLKPKITRSLHGAEPKRGHLVPFEQNVQEELSYLGINFPLFTAAIEQKQGNILQENQTTPIRSLPMTKPIRSMILEGMDKVLWSEKGNSKLSSMRALHLKPEWASRCNNLKGQVVGKSATGEILVKPNINPSSQPCMYKHIWFGLISFEPSKERWEKPELVVVVQLKYGDAGREAAPAAMLMVQKWREIKEKQGSHRYQID